MSRKDIGLYPRQLEILQRPGSEILAVGEGGGKSHAFRAGAVLFASSLPGSNCVLVHPNADELQREHVEGPTGIKAMLSEAIQGGAVEIQPGSAEARFANGSRISWLALNRGADQRRLASMPEIHFGAIDAADRVALDQYQAIVLKAEHAQPRRGRIVAAANSMSGWLADRWSVNGSSGRAVVATSEDDLPGKLRVASEQPTIAEFLDGLGDPRLMPDSPLRRSRHAQKVIEVLQRWFFGEFRRLMILMPTQHGKTTLGVRVMTAYIEFCRPYETVGIASYSDTVAQRRSRDARDIYTRGGGRLLDGASSVDYWKTQYGGGVWAAGFVGAQAGNPMTWGLVDDPDRNTKESRSPTMMRDKDDWYLETWLGREDKFADRRMSQLWCATRFHRKDTVGRILDIHVEREEPWHILALPAVYDPEVAEYYERLGGGLFTVEPDFRTEPGEPIDPERYDRAYWETNRRSSLRKFLGRDQQKPEELDGGSIFDEGWPIDVPVDPAFRGDLRVRKVYLAPIRAWDLAATAGGGDWTACVSMGEVRETGRYMLRHAARAKLSARDVMRFMAGTMLVDGPDVDIVIPADPAAAGKHQTGRITEYLREVSKRVSIKCSGCKDRRCKKCNGTGKLRFRVPIIHTVSTREGIQERFENFADRAHPISDDVEGYVDFVASPWAPSIEDTVPWFNRAVSECDDRDWQEELRQIQRLMRRFTNPNEDDPDLVWLEWQTPYLRELHLFPDANHDDWVAATAHGWGALDATGRVFFPKG